MKKSKELKIYKSLVKKVGKYHRPIERVTPNGIDTYCDGCSNLVTMDCPEYVHLIKYPCRTVRILFGDDE